MGILDTLLHIAVSVNGFKAGIEGSFPMPYTDDYPHKKAYDEAYKKGQEAASVRAINEVRKKISE